jgi:hypothetical protein
MTSRIYSKTGGALFTHFHASWPFAVFTADGDAIQISLPWNDYEFPRNEILRLSRYLGIFSIGMRIQHAVEAYPDLVAFTPSILGRNSDFERLKVGVEGLGYEVQDWPLNKINPASDQK